MYWKIIKSHMCTPLMKGSESKVRLDERVAAVTGANTGIGFETAQAWLPDGDSQILREDVRENGPYWDLL